MRKKKDTVNGHHVELSRRYHLSSGAKIIFY